MFFGWILQRTLQIFWHFLTLKSANGASECLLFQPYITRLSCLLDGWITALYDDIWYFTKLQKDKCNLRRGVGSCRFLKNVLYLTGQNVLESLGYLLDSSDSHLILVLKWRVNVIAFARHFQGLLDMSDVTDLQISESLDWELLITDDVNYCEWWSPTATVGWQCIIVLSLHIVQLLWADSV